MRLIPSCPLIPGLCLALASLISCAGPTWVEAAVEAYGSSSAELTALRTFSYQASVGSATELRDRSLYDQVRVLLEQKGLSAAEPAEFRIHLRAETRATTIEIPAHYEMGRRFAPGYYHTSYLRGADGHSRSVMIYSPSTWQSIPYRVPARSIPAFAHHLQLDFRAVDGTILWQGTIDIIDRSRDMVGLLRLFLPGLLDEFPLPSGSGIERRARRIPPTAEGQSVDPADAS